MDLKLKGKKALVTGSSAGLGEAIAIQLAAEGASVVILDMLEPLAYSPSHNNLPKVARNDMSNGSVFSTFVPPASDIVLKVASTFSKFFYPVAYRAFESRLYNPRVRICSWLPHISCGLLSKFGRGCQALSLRTY